MLAEDGDSTGQACTMEGLFQGDSMKLVLLSCGDAKDVMFINEDRSDSRQVVSGHINDTVWG